MGFCAYMLHCRGGAFYTGHTDNLEHRIAQHEAGVFPGFTSDKLPVALVWSQEFPTRLEALAAERQIKGWSRAKKMALIRGDWSALSALAKGKTGPSTSSGRTDLGGASASSPARLELAEGLSLLCHPDTPAYAIQSITVAIKPLSSGMVQLDYAVHGETDGIRLPAPAPPLRRDGLWQATCFEAFYLHRNGPAYLEFNFSPSAEWAAYGFTEYRDVNRTDARLPAPPTIELPLRRADRLILRAAVRLPDNLRPTRLALSAVIEETDGTKSYWALRHPPGAPDFHHPDCFALTLEAPRPA